VIGDVGLDCGLHFEESKAELIEILEGSSPRTVQPFPELREEPEFVFP
jgi:hypothetical protein